MHGCGALLGHANQYAQALLPRREVPAGLHALALLIPRVRNERLNCSSTELCTHRLLSIVLHITSVNMYVHLLFCCPRQTCVSRHDDCFDQNFWFTAYICMHMNESFLLHSVTGSDRVLASVCLTPFDFSRNTNRQVLNLLRGSCLAIKIPCNNFSPWKACFTTRKDLVGMALDYGFKQRSVVNVGVADTVGAYLHANDLNERDMRGHMDVTLIMITVRASTRRSEHEPEVKATK